MKVPVPRIVPRLVPIAALIFGVACATDTEPTASSERGAGTTEEPAAERPAPTEAPAEAPAPTEPPAPAETPSQSNARGSAESYLEYTAFSRTGLIGQLKFEGFSEADAAYGVDALDVDWNEQAAKSAESYLEYSSFSRTGLIDQLKFEGFTQEQAEHGVGTTGL